MSPTLTVTKINILKTANIFFDPLGFLLGYCDASRTAYSAVIYARTIFKDKITVKFVTAKSKVVSNKDFSIPRIELFSCLLLLKLISTVVSTMSVEVVVSKTVYWTDLLVVLRRIKRGDKEDVDSSSWRLIPGKLNSADIATCECRPKVLPHLWFHAPEFLKSLNEKQPAFETVQVGIEELRTKLTVNALSMTKSNEFGIGKINDYKCIIHSCAIHPFPTP